MGISRDRAEGALLGLAVGDALGTTLEFSHPALTSFAEPRTGPLCAIEGGGPFDVAPGQVTDDSMMAVCLADSLRAHGGFDARDVASRYVAWSDVTFDIGSQTGNALSRVAAVTDPRRAGIECWINYNKKPAGNGSLMRTAPIGVWFAADAEKRRSASMDDSLITHADPRCVLACAALNGAIAAALTNDDPSPTLLLEAARVDVLATRDALRAHLDDDDAIAHAFTAVSADLNLATSDDPDLYGDEIHLHRTQGFVRVALRIAFWQLFHARSFEAALVDVVNRGGDSDTNGAITGALLGARFGAAAIPQAFRHAVLEALADAPRGPFRDTYHPRALLDLVAEMKTTK